MFEKLLNWIKGVIKMFSKDTIKNVLDVNVAVSSDMVNAIPTEFDTNVSMSSSSSIGSSYDMYVNAFIQYHAYFRRFLRSAQVLLKNICFGGTQGRRYA